MNAQDIVQAFESGDIVTLINALELVGVELIPTPDGGSILLGTVGSTGVSVSTEGAMVLHGHGDGNVIAAQACQADMSRKLWDAIGQEFAMAHGIPLEYEGIHRNTSE